MAAVRNGTIPSEERTIPVFKGKGRHVRRRFVGPLFAVEALLVTLGAKREMDAAVKAQLSEYAQDGAR